MRAARRAARRPEEAAIFDVQISILEDDELIEQVEAYIRQNLGAEKAFDLVHARVAQPLRRSTRRR